MNSPEARDVFAALLMPALLPGGRVKGLLSAAAIQRAAAQAVQAADALLAELERTKPEKQGDAP